MSKFRNRSCVGPLQSLELGMIVGLLAAGHSHERILQAYPHLEADDLTESLNYAAWRLQEQEEPLIVISPQ